ncbi:substrate-binding periplasmic protein [Litorilituus lipolyticus]|uniref:Transporter substrate-binding domain-containing protein n=1 Tax=Litorilituus lipolyticus TaxID=2491017 RepID=A0A502L454_9GAMM|nr:transporter substrate-binding domain-containing protein [Litorilituus lipolyticus]TPH15067.1 transporter substrate-binding domain-containing protein [Litorilituus lipolyticus]
MNKNTSSKKIYLYALLLLIMARPEITWAKDLLLLSDDGPPHMIEATKGGIDIDITREVLQSMGHNVRVGFVPLKRSMKQVANKEADLFLPTFFQQDTEELFISAPIISYRPTIFTLKENNFVIEEISDLSGKMIITFQGATGYFGDEFMKVSKNSAYQELPDMSILPEMLIKKRCDVVILDYYIFYYFLQKYLKQNPKVPFEHRNIKNTSLFPAVQAHVGFNNSQLRDQFNEQLVKYKNSNKDKAVIHKYIAPILN